MTCSYSRRELLGGGDEQQVDISAAVVSPWDRAGTTPDCSPVNLATNSSSSEDWRFGPPSPRVPGRSCSLCPREVRRPPHLCCAADAARIVSCYKAAADAALITAVTLFV